MKRIFLKRGVFFLILGVILISPNTSKSYGAILGQGGNAMTQKEYEEAKRGQDKFHALLRAGDASFKNGDNQQAEQYYLAAYKFSKKSSSETVARYALAKFYHDTGRYKKSLELVDIDLPKLKPEEPAWKMYSEMKDDLLRKIEAQKSGHEMQKASAVPATSLSQSANTISDFQKADYATQKKFLEKNLSEETEILRLSKQAMLAEHAGKFAEAKKYYEQLLSRKEDVTAAQGEGAWSMLHCAVQRTSEVTGDESREKEMLMWIKANMLDPQGEYHKYLAGLLPNVQDHLKTRLKYFNL
jgi:tetratricopeptide (TPR) repeat protein